MKETVAAYSEGPSRNLNFKASEAVTIDDAIKIMCKALDCRQNDEAYNDFRPAFLKKLPKNSLVTLAREGSVCVYVHSIAFDIDEEKLRIKMGADECDIRDGSTIRLWWD